jgi:hypothetical protein
MTSRKTLMSVCLRIAAFPRLRDQAFAGVADLMRAGDADGAAQACRIGLRIALHDAFKSVE